MKIETHIEELIDTLGDNFNILQYVYNNAEFIPGETPVYYSGPYWDKKEIIAAVKALLTGKWLSSGEQVKRFEQEFAKIVGDKDAVMVNSGSSANLIMLAATKKYFGWKDGDEIIVSVVGFPTTVAPIVQNNLKPVFIDIELDTLNFDLDLITEKFTKNTQAILLSPVLGNPPDMDKLATKSSKLSVSLLLDNCDSLGSKWNDIFLTEYVNASSHSFYPAHHISTGEGGMVTSIYPKIIAIARSMVWWGRDCHCVGTENLLSGGVCKNRFSNWLKNYNGIVDHKYVFTNMGYNLKPMDFQGAIGLEQLKKLDEIHFRRKQSQEVITNIFLHNIPELDIPKVLRDAKPSWFGTPFICPNKEFKDKLVNYLESKKIQTRNYFAGNILLHPGYEHLGDYREYPNANKVLDLVFFVGASPHYGDNIFNYFEETLRKFR